MQWKTMPVADGRDVPWGAQPDMFTQTLLQRLGCSTAAVGVLDVTAPSLDEVLCAAGLDMPRLERWCATEHRRDPLLSWARQEGWALSGQPTPGDARQVGAQRTSNGDDTIAAGTPLLPGLHAMMHMLPESHADRRWWWLLLGRRGQAFTPAEQRTAGLLLRQWQIRFHAIPEPGMGRLLLGHDNRVLLADVDTQLNMLDQPHRIATLLDTLGPVIDQRFPELEDRSTRDVAINLDALSHWVCLRRDRVVPQPEAMHGYLETRRLAPGDLPAVGVVEDSRIAKALAYLHQRFSQSPSLAQVAQAVHMSPFHFHRLFTRQVGISPKQYLQRKQLQVARWMLRATREPIGTIAAQTGFSSHGHFTSTFHRIVGISPSDYRDQAAQKHGALG